MPAPRTPDALSDAARMAKRRSILSLRRIALSAAVLLRGRHRAAAWTAHELLRLGPTLWRNSDWHGPIARILPTQNPEVWLTIDDGPNPETTPQLLALLAAAGARASFFVIGKHVDAHRGLCRRILADGHTLENHTYSHLPGLFWALPGCIIRDEILRCNHSIRVATGTRPTWFRSPAGLTNACVHPAAAASWLRVAGWSAAGRDGLPGADPQKVAARIARDLRPGAIVLLHDGNGARSAETLRLVLAEIAARGLHTALPNITPKK